jgi:hypothetical protein
MIYKSYMRKYKGCLEYKGVELYVEYYYIKAECGGFDLPSHPDDVEIQDVSVLTVSIFNLLSDEQIKEIESIIIKDHQA